MNVDVITRSKSNALLNSPERATLRNLRRSRNTDQSVGLRGNFRYGQKDIVDHDLVSTDRSGSGKVLSAGVGYVIILIDAVAQPAHQHTILVQGQTPREDFLALATATSILNTVASGIRCSPRIVPSRSATASVMRVAEPEGKRITAGEKRKIRKTFSQYLSPGSSR